MKKRLILFLIYIFPLIIGMIFVLNQTFPKQTFYIGQDPSKTTLYQIENRRFVAVPIYDFNKIDVDLEGNLNEGAREVLIKKDYIVNFYPILESQEFTLGYQLKSYNNKHYLVTKKSKKLIPTEKILNSYGGASNAIAMEKEEFDNLPLSENLAGFIDGTLLKYRDSAYVISKGKKVLITSAEVFDNMGYDWDKLIEVEADEARIHSNSPEPLTLSSPHPDGTIIQSDQNVYYLIKNEKRQRLEPEIYERYFSKVNPINIEFHDQRSELQTRTCILNNILNCSIKPDSSFKDQIGNGYSFILPENLKLKEARMIFTRRFSLENLKITVRKFR